ncbi:MAG: hypothetical protein ACOYT8_01140 [Candidatus Dependentiae bacterium]
MSKSWQIIFISWLSFFQLIGMEKNPPEADNFYLRLSDKVIQQKIVDEIIATSNNVPDAVQAFIMQFGRQLHINNKFNDKHNQAVVFVFLNNLSKKFPNQELLITRLLYPEYQAIQHWYYRQKNRKRKIPLVLQPTDKKQLNNALLFIEANNIPELHVWLKMGHDPNAPIKDGSLLTQAISKGSIEMVHLLVLYGADLYSLIDIPGYRFRGTPYEFLLHLLDKTNGVYKQQLNALKDYFNQLINVTNG